MFQLEEKINGVMYRDEYDFLTNAKTMLQVHAHQEMLISSK